MKKIVLAALLGTSCLAGMAQAKWDVKAGMSMSNLTQMDGNAKVGYTVGIGMDYAFTDNWSLQSGLNFTSKGSRETDHEDGFKEYFKINSHYVELPVLAAFKFPVTEQIKLTVNAGPYLAVGLGGKMKYDFHGITAGDENLFTQEKDQDKAYMKRFDMGLQYGIGAELNEHFLVNLSGQYGFISPFNEPYDKLLSDDGKTPKNMSVTLSVGYRF